MNNNEKGITLVSLVVTIVVLLILSGVLVNVSIKQNPVIESVQEIQNDYYNEKTQTQQKVNKMVNGWENVIK